MPTTTLLFSHGVLRRGLADVVGDRQAGLLDLVPDGVQRHATVVVDVAVVVLTRVQRQQKCLEPQRLQLRQRAPGALRIPPVDQPDTVEVAVAALLQIGHVFVVNAEDPLPQLLVRVVEQRQYGIGEGQFPVDAVLAQFADARLDVVGRGTGQIVVLHQYPAEVTAYPGLALHSDHVRAVLVPDARRSTLEVVGEPFVEDVVGHRDVVVRGEHLGPGRQPEVPRRMAAPILGRTVSAGRVQGDAGGLSGHH